MVLDKIGRVAWVRLKASNEDMQSITQLCGEDVGVHDGDLKGLVRR